jgi:hypothetical protein
MKLLIITAIKSIDKDVKQMLKQADVKPFLQSRNGTFRQSEWFEINKRERLHTLLCLCTIGNVGTFTKLNGF